MERISDSLVSDENYKVVDRRMDSDFVTVARYESNKN